MFGGGQINQQNSIFGNTTNTGNATGTGTGGGGLFGTGVTGGLGSTLFSSTNATAPAAAPGTASNQTPSLFGAPAANAAPSPAPSTSLFGNTSAGGLFGNTSANTNTNLFGTNSLSTGTAGAAGTAGTAAGGLGLSAGSTAGKSLFGSQPAGSGGGLFGTGAGLGVGGGLFASNPPVTPQPIGPTANSSANAPTPAVGTGLTGTGLTGGTPAAAPTTAPTSLFGAATAAAAAPSLASGLGGGLFGTKPSGTSLFGAAPAAQPNPTTPLTGAAGAPGATGAAAASTDAKAAASNSLFGAAPLSLNIPGSAPPATTAAAPATTAGEATTGGVSGATAADATAKAPPATAGTATTGTATAGTASGGNAAGASGTTSTTNTTTGGLASGAGNVGSLRGGESSKVDEMSLSEQARADEVLMGWERCVRRQVDEFSRYAKAVCEMDETLFDYVEKLRVIESQQDSVERKQSELLLQTQILKHQQDGIQGLLDNLEQYIDARYGTTRGNSVNLNNTASSFGGTGSGAGAGGGTQREGYGRSEGREGEHIDRRGDDGDRPRTAPRSKLADTAARLNKDVSEMEMKIIELTREVDNLQAAFNPDALGHILLLINAHAKSLRTSTYLAEAVAANLA